MAQSSSPPGSNRFVLRLDSDCQGDPPKIFVYDTRHKYTVMEILEEPIPLKENPDSFNDNDWQYPTFALQTLWLLNEYS